MCPKCSKLSYTDIWQYITCGNYGFCWAFRNRISDLPGTGDLACARDDLPCPSIFLFIHIWVRLRRRRLGRRRVFGLTYFIHSGSFRGIYCQPLGAFHWSISTPVLSDTTLDVRIHFVELFPWCVLHYLQKLRIQYG